LKTNASWNSILSRIDRQTYLNEKKKRK